MASQLSEFLHFTVTLLLATPSQLNKTYIQNNDLGAVPCVLKDYGFTPDEAAAINNEILGPVSANADLRNAFRDLAAKVTALAPYDGSGVHPNGTQANALVQTLRPIAVTPNV